MSDLILLSNVRLSFPHLVEPQRKVSPETGKERVSYSADFIMPPDHPGFKQFMNKVNELSLAKWKEHAGNVMAIRMRGAIGSSDCWKASLMVFQWSPVR